MTEAIEQARKPSVDAVAGWNALERTLAIYQSAVAGGPVKPPLSGVASTHFAGRGSGPSRNNPWAEKRSDLHACAAYLQ